jgi:hypothetical protein
VKLHYYKTCRAILLAAAILAAPAAFANSVQFDFGPAGAPVLTALFQDAGPGQVNLTIDAFALNGNSVNSICFNLNPIFDANELNFTETSSAGGVSGLARSANDSYKVTGGGGKFDIAFTFDPNFQTGDSVTYSITGIPNLSVSDFLFLETATAGGIPGYAAGSIQQFSGLVIVQGTPNVSAVPDIPSTLGLLVMAMIAVGILARRSKVAARAWIGISRMSGETPDAR